MTVDIRGDHYILTLTTKEIGEIGYSMPQKIRELIEEAKRVPEGFATKENGN